MKTIAITIAMSVAWAPVAVKAEAIFAVSCAGTMTADINGASPKSRTTTRTYVIDPERQTASYFNPEIGKAFELCRSWIYLPCRNKFWPHTIQIWSEGKTGSSMLFSLNRETGAVWDSAGSLEVGFERFDGICERAQIPMADVSRNRF